MCKIHYISNKNNKTLSEGQLKKFFDMMIQGSATDPCAWGILCDKFYFKEKGNFDQERVSEQLIGFLKNAEPTFLVGHNRLSTKGNSKNNINNHPVGINNFWVMHNGTIHNDVELKEQFKLEYEGLVDSLIIPALTNFFVKKEGDEIVSAIKKCAELLEGTYSCFIYDNLRDELYYFKSSGTTFYVNQSRKGEIIGSTNDMFFDSIWPKKVKKEQIFRIKGGVWDVVGVFKQKKVFSHKTNKVLGGGLSCVPPIVYGDELEYTWFIKMVIASFKGFGRILYQIFMWWVKLGKETSTETNKPIPLIPPIKKSRKKKILKGGKKKGVRR